MNPEFLTFLQARSDVGPDGPTIAWFSAGEVLEALWPLNALFTPRLAAIKATPYDEAAEEECDGAIMAFALDPRPDTLAPLSDAGWRVLYERHSTVLTIVAAEDGRPDFIRLPLELPAQDRAGAVMLALHLRRPRSELLSVP